MTTHYDSLETRSPEQREGELFAALPAHIAHAKGNAPYFATLLADVNPREIASRKALATLPVTRKSDLVELQKQRLPFGGLNAIGPGRLARLFVSPGPIYDVEGTGIDFWRTARAMYAAGFRAGDIVHNTFSYHLTPAGSMFETGAHALGCAVIPAGTGQTEMQVATINALKPNAYAGTPSFLKMLFEKADELGGEIGSIRKAIVSGEAFLAPAREFIKARGVEAYQTYGSADLGIIAYESVAREGLILDEKIIVEIVRPGSGEPVADGEVGEVVVTTFNRDYPLIRFATGDLSAVLAGTSPCGRTNIRIKGWMGRADQTTKVRGMFVHPHQIAEIIKRHPAIHKARLTVSHVDSADAMLLSCETTEALDMEAVKNSIRDVTKLRGEVELVAKGALANDGKVIEDCRVYT
ncbi:MAG: AMP-binding protein [Burkholderiales bacterium]|nr:AMP-binding protein [Burkholderiales bacterium]